MAKGNLGSSKKKNIRKKWKVFLVSSNAPLMKSAFSNSKRKLKYIKNTFKSECSFLNLALKGDHKYTLYK